MEESRDDDGETWNHPDTDIDRGMIKNEQLEETINNAETVEIVCITDDRELPDIWDRRKLNYCQFPSFPQHSG